MPSCDLSALEAKVYPNAHPIDRFMVVAFGALLAIWAIETAFEGPAVVEHLIRVAGRPFDAATVLDVLAVTLVIALGLVVSLLLASILIDGVPHRWRGPVQLDVDATGFTLLWRQGPSLTRRWDQLRVPLRVEDFSEQGPKHGSKMRLSRPLRLPRVEAIPNEAAAALASEARRLGMSVQDCDTVTSLGTHGRLHLISTSP